MRIAAGSLVVVALVLAACDGGESGDDSSGDDSGGDDSSGDDSGDDATGPDATLEDLGCAAYASALCGRLDDCPQLAWHYADAASCEADQAALCGARGETPTTGFTSTALTTCTTAIETAACDQLINPSRFSVMVRLPECRPSGTADDGEACVFDSDCVSVACDIDFDSGCGECANVSPPDHGPMPHAGDACEDGGPACADGVCIDHFCVADLEEGDACDGAAGPHCQPHLACVEDACVLLPILDADSPQGSFGVCGPGLWADDGKCLADRGVGASCMDEGDWACVDGTFCIADTCQPYDDAATACAL